MWQPLSVSLSKSNVELVHEYWQYSLELNPGQVRGAVWLSDNSCCCFSSFFFYWIVIANEQEHIKHDAGSKSPSLKRPQKGRLFWKTKNKHRWLQHSPMGTVVLGSKEGVEVLSWAGCHGRIAGGAWEERGLVMATGPGGGGIRLACDIDDIRDGWDCSPWWPMASGRGAVTCCWWWCCWWCCCCCCQGGLKDCREKDYISDNRTALIIKNCTDNITALIDWLINWLLPANHNDYIRTDWKTRQNIHTLHTIF